MSLRVLVIGSDLSYNKGGPAIFCGCLTSLRDACPTVKVTFLSTAGDRDLAMAEEFGVDIVGITLKEMLFSLIPRLFVWRLIGLDRLLEHDAIGEILDADVYIDITGISFSDHMSFRSSCKHAMRLLPGILSGRPLVKYPHATGPYEGRLNRWLARYCLSYVDLLVARGEDSQHFLEELGVPGRVEVRPDSAFLMRAASPSRVDQILTEEYGYSLEPDDPLIGVSASSVLHAKMSRGDSPDDRYEELMADLIDFILKMTGARVLLVPHSSVPEGLDVPEDIPEEEDEVAVDRQLGGLSLVAEDDAWVSRRVRRRTKRKSRVHVLGADYTPEDLKGVIGRCDCFVASRFHSMVAALGMLVPTMVVGWSHKYAEVLDMFGQRHFACTHSEATLADLKAMFSDLWYRKRAVREELATALPDVECLAMSSGQLVLELLSAEEGG